MKTVAGLDVHKDSVYLCIMRENGEKIERVYDVLTPELDSMRDFMTENDVSEAAMESTSVYWIPIWRVLVDSFDLKLVNPYFIKQLPGRKSDVKDAQWIAECVLKELIRDSYIPAPKVQKLRLYDRRIFELNAELGRKKSKIDAILQRCNIRLSNYVSNTDCKSYKNVVTQISEGVTSPKELLKSVHKRIINKHGEKKILASLTGIISDAEIDMLSQYVAESTLLEDNKNKCIEKMREICNKEFEEQMKNLQTIPGVSERSALAILAEIGPNVNAFPSARHLVSWCGFNPRNDESNKNIKSNKITHGNRFIRVACVQCAWAASRTKDCYFSKFYAFHTQVRKKFKLKVIVAVARKILVCVWHILNSNVPYRDFVTSNPTVKDCIQLT